MSTCTNRFAHADFERIASPSWWQKLERLLAAWKLRLEAHDERRIDNHFRREREAHERFLERAGDRYELERLERSWERRQEDFWRVF